MNIQAFTIVNIISLVSLIINAILVVWILSQMKQLSQNAQEITYYKNILKEVDEQAQIIIQTDMQKHVAEEALDKRIHSLLVLQKISHLLSSTLDKDEIFTCLHPEDIKQLGFEKGFIFLTESNRDTIPFCFNLSSETIDRIRAGLFQPHIRNHVLSISNDKRTVDSAGLDKSLGHEIIDQLRTLFACKTFLVSPLKILIDEFHPDSFGFILLGYTEEKNLEEGDQELAALLADTISHAVENARLFEEEWKAQRELEKKVKERTVELSQALSEVKAATRRKSEFVSSVSHELRTPLSSIKGYASLLSQGKAGELPESIKERLDIIDKKSNQLVKMVDELLDISRIESGKTPVHFERISLTEIIKQTVDLLNPQTTQKNITIEEISSDLPAIEGDPQLLSRVFINIISNAIKYTPQNGIIHVQTTALPDKNAVHVVVEDNGPGISNEDKEKVFQEFYRIQGTEEIKGTGLGLTLTRRIIDAHNGRIWIEDSPLGGAKFIVQLLIKKADQHAE